MRVRRTRLMRDAGPYKVVSNYDGTLVVYPEWSMYDGKPAWKRETEEDQRNAGGHGFFSRMGLAADLERWLNGGEAS